MDTNPVEYFKEYDFAESFVQRIVSQPELSRLEIILIYMGFVPALARPLDDPAYQDPWDFRRLLFSDVTQLARTDYRFKVGFQGFDPMNFNLSKTEPAPIATVTVEGASVRKIVDARRKLARYRAGIHMGSFGAYGFDFGSLSADQRLVKIVPLPGRKPGHFDYYTGRRIDWDNPFSDD